MDYIQRNSNLLVVLMVLILVLGISIVYQIGDLRLEDQLAEARGSRSHFEDAVAPEPGVELPVVWGDFGKKMVESGVIDREKFEKIYEGRGGLSSAEKKLLYGNGNGKLVMNRDNAGFLLNLLWGLGLGNKNSVLENGPMNDPAYGGAGNFASTGGWIIAKGSPMSHYSRYHFIDLNRAQQELVERVSKNIYRPCCGNSVYFPDCNHGMAMLALLELMAAQGISESDMYKYALAVNSYWFPDTYVTIARYFEMKGTEWKDVDAKTALGNDFSSARGIQRVSDLVGPEGSSGGGSCGV